MRMTPQFLPVVAVLLCISTRAQDRIYLDKEQKDGKVIEVTDDKVRYKNPLNPGPVYSVSRNKVLFVFSETGNFLVLDKVEPAGSLASAAIGNFLAPPAGNRQDRIFTSQKKELVCDIVKEEDASVSVNVNGIDMKLEKTVIALIVYKDGKHKLFCDPAVASEILLEAQTKTLATLSRPAANTETPVTSVNPPKKDAEGPSVQMPAVKTETLLSGAAGSREPTAGLIGSSETKSTETKIIRTAPLYAAVIIKANKQSAIVYNINDTLSGEVKPTMGKRLLLKPGQYNYKLDDKQGNITESTISIGENDLGREIAISFPEINYAAIKLEEARKKKASADSLSAIRAQAAEVMRMAHENNLQVLKDGLTGTADEILMLQASIEKSILQIRNGGEEFDAGFIGKGKELEKLRTRFADIRKLYLDSASLPADKEKKETFLRQLKTKEDKFNTRSDKFIENVQAGREAMSQDLMTALKKARTNDLGYFIQADSVNEKKIEGEYLVMYAIKKQLHYSILKHLVDKGAEVNYFGKRFADNREIYETPMAVACINGDENTVKVLADAKAAFVPTLSSPKEKRHNLKYVLTRISNPRVKEILKSSGYDLNDGTDDMLNALKSVEAGMVKVEGGYFTMGCTEDQKNDCVAAETPAIQVSVKNFSISKFEVTRRQWIAIMDGDNHGEFKDCMDCPVEGITYDTAIAFLSRLNSISEKKYRLPTEAEWEYAARGGKSASKTFRFAGSDDFNEVSLSKDNGTGKPKPVGQKKPNDLGLYDMSGNVAEWCSDWYIERYYLNSTKNNPLGPEEGSQKVLRGGSWNLSSWSARVSGRRGVEKNMVNSGIGFRLASDE
ncbi:SUMF1/EgtB/PvdO family nonheme iron enzyme [Sediminibacterium soli]|uniref:SUMF1/EgtB/PvdO family nonheme iron enzyme n=1 Tax=Sediminibacterium soli TaxID=2698829 RepID=UPI00137B2CD6|nr:SUMF1/EgtB/PvdO family nonheme iron enzyme [Sediminibacterium soli]NCI45242.1 formylglycine-generating enzyme family protein [Sediminibacterium soli]